MHRRLISAICATSLVLLAAPPVHAAPPTRGEAPPSPAPASEPATRIEQAIEAWRKGEWTEVRDLLEPLVQDDAAVDDELLLESALRYLAEATLLDEGLEPDERTELARGYVLQLLENSPEWSPPSGLHGRAFYDLVAEIRSELDSARAEACRGELIACEADFEELRAAHEDLERDFAQQKVVVTEYYIRNRGLAFLPLGVGHFTNGNNALGGTFLALEVATGAAGLGLLLYRVRGLGCVRTNGFAPKSLVCPGGDEEDLPRLQDHIENTRNAEIVMGYLFLGSVVLDIVIAQVLFKPTTEVDRGMMTREEIERERESGGGGRRKNRRNKPGAELEIHPYPAYIPGGAGFGVSLRF